MKTIEALKNCFLFQNLEENLLKKIHQIGITQKFDENSFIFYEGEKGKYFYVLLDGLVKIYKSTDDGREVVLKLIKPGENFGEVIVFEKNDYPVSSVSIKKSNIFLINKNDFIELIKNPEFSFHFIAMLFKKMRYLAEKVKTLTSYDVEERFFHFIADHYGKSKEIKLDLSKKEIADAIGTIPETFSRMLKRLKSRKILEWDNNLIKIDIDYYDEILQNIE